MESIPTISELFPNQQQAAVRRNSIEDLGSEEFLALMVAQLENQDPTNPQDNMQFLAQIAQFGTVSGIQELQQDFRGVSSALSANQVVEAAGLVGREVVTSSNMGVLGADNALNATVDLAQGSPQVTLYVQDETGRLVHSEVLGGASAGELRVSWDGLNAAGIPFPQGNYRVSAEALIDGQNQAVPVYVHSAVNSVTVNQSSGGVQLNLAGGTSVSMTEVRSFL